MTRRPELHRRHSVSRAPKREGGTRVGRFAGSSTVPLPPGEVTIDDGEMTVTTSKLNVRGVVDGIDQAEFQKAATAASKGCPVSRALGGVKVSLESAQLEK